MLSLQSNKSQVERCGTVSLVAQYGTQKHIIHLENVNYIPSNRWNIFALGQWDSQECQYQAMQGMLTLFNYYKLLVIKGHKITTNIYKFHMVPNNMSNLGKSKVYFFSCNEPKQSWEIWHHQFGHISYNGLKTLHKQHLIDRMTVDPNTPTPDCVSCTEAKHTVTPFSLKSENICKRKGELTHIDLWGKYNVTSISGHQYYLLMVDDAMWCVTVCFLKVKHEASQQVKNYLAHLQVRSVAMYVIRVDRGTEFINKDLQT